MADLIMRNNRGKVWATGTLHGVRRDLAPSRLPIGAATAAAGWVLDRDVLGTAPGRARHSTLPVTGAGRALGVFQDVNLTPACRLVAALGTALYATDSATQTFAPGTNTGLTLHATNRPRLAQMAVDGVPWLYVVDGSNPVRRWRPGETAVTLTDLQAPATAPILNTGTVAQTLGDTHTNGRVIIGSRSGYYVKRNGTDGNFTTAEVFGRFFPKDGWFDNPNAGFTYLTARLFSESAHVWDQYRSSIALEFLDDGLGGMRGGAGLRCELITYADLTRCSSLTVRVKPYYTAGTGTITPELLLQTAEETWETLALTGTLTPETWCTLTADLSTLSEAQLLSVRGVEVAFSLGAGVPCMARQETEGACLPDYGNAVTFVLDGIYKDVSDPLIVPDTYEFTFTYQYTDGAESAPYQTDDLDHPYPSLVVADDFCRGFQIVVTEEAGTYTRINLYARGGVYKDFRQVGYIDLASISAGRTQTFLWGGTVEPDAPLLAEYVQVAPSGAALLCPFKGRMVYAKGPTLYVSNDGDGDHVPKAALEIMSGTQGFMTDADEGGAAITGLGVLGEQLLILTTRGLWRLVGQDASDMQILPVEGRLGCAAQETVQCLGGSLLCWLDPSGLVLAWDGMQVVEIGAGITPLLETTTAAQRAAAFAEVDDTEGRYLLTIPDAATATATPSSTTYCWHRDARDWTTWPSQCGGAAGRATGAATPGRYQLDRYATSALFRETGTTLALPTGTTPNACAYSWTSGVFSLPALGRHKSLEQIQIHFADGEAPASVTLTLYTNGSAIAAATQSCTVRGNRACWTPARLANVETYQLQISGSTTAAVAVRAIELVVADLGGRV